MKLLNLSGKFVNNSLHIEPNKPAEENDDKLVIVVSEIASIEKHSRNLLKIGMKQGSFKEICFVSNDDNMINGFVQNIFNQIAEA